VTCDHQRYALCAEATCFVFDGRRLLQVRYQKRQQHQSPAQLLDSQWREKCLRCESAGPRQRLHDKYLQPTEKRQ
jgi:gluconate kinase